MNLSNFECVHKAILTCQILPEHHNFAWTSQLWTCQILPEHVHTIRQVHKVITLWTCQMLNVFTKALWTCQILPENVHKA